MTAKDVSPSVVDRARRLLRVTQSHQSEANEP
jgi:hypothetical protein